MFSKLRAGRWLLMEVDDRGLAIGFAGRAARIARVHQFGEKAAIEPGGAKQRSPARVLIGLTDDDREMVRERLLRHIPR